MIVGIHQPNFLPWIGYFKKMLNSDIFVMLDDVEFNNRSYTKRVKIRVGNKKKWLIVPINSDDKHKKIFEVRINNSTDWKQKHLKTFKHMYGSADYFDEIFDLLQEPYSKEYNKLIDLNLDLINVIKKYLGISTKIVFSSKLNIKSEKHQRILDICKSLNATDYLSGMGAKKYNVESEFEQNNIKISYNTVKKVEYEQLGDGFIFGLSIIDLLFNNGKKSIDIIKES